MFELHNFEYIQIGIASPDKIRSWSSGEVTKSETINYKSQKPEKDGLFCEKIFGPTRDWECHCGKYKKVRFKGMTCEKCGVDIVQSKVRRERMGTIELAAPVSHFWYFRGNPSKIGLMLELSNKELEQVIYIKNYIVLDPGNTELSKKQVVTLTQIQAVKQEIESQLDAEGNPIKCTLRVGTGAEAIKELLCEIDLDEKYEEISKKIQDLYESNAKKSKGTQNVSANNAKREQLVKKLEVVDSFRKSKQRPEWMILDVIPVIPPELRPMVPLDGGRYATSDLNELYRRVINRNNRLKKFIGLNAPPAMINNEKRMLQEAVDALIDNGKRGKAITGPGNRELKSLSGLLRGKQGRFRQNLLGKRVDYSGRSVIVVGPELKLYQCGLPKEMAIELFKPFVMKKLVDMKECHTVKAARHAVERLNPIVWDILEEVIKDHPVLLNRAPTLHRLSIQAFEPVLIEGRAIKLHPLVCTAFNADFDGDQMAVHVPLSLEAQAEARFLMLASNNILKLSDGQPVMSPSQDMVLGCYYLTIKRREIGKTYMVNGVEEVYQGGMYASEEEALIAYQTKSIALQDEIYVRRTLEIDGVKQTGRIKTTVGRMIFNNAIPQDINYNFKSDTTETEQEKERPYLNDKRFQFKIDTLIKKGELKKIVDACFKQGGSVCAANTLDSIKTLGYKYSTVGVLTTSVFDMFVPKTKDEVIEQATKDVHKISKQFGRGLLTEDERYKAVVDIWTETTKKVTDILKASQEKFNPIWMMADSGARGSIDQIKQLAGMRGLMTNPQGKVIEIPVKSCFREGLSVLEYFISSHGGRKGLADTALKTSDSGYLTRRLVDVAQVVIVREDDCGDRKGRVVSAIMPSNGETKPIEKLADRIAGRYTVEAIVNSDGEILAPADSMITEDQAKAIEKAGITSVKIRSVFSCQTHNGVCARCYGKNMSSMNPVTKGEAVGVIAAQSIGEPGTQLTMRTFHTGGIASTGDITQGLPRIEELFEVRNPKGKAIICEIDGTVSLHENEKNGARIVKITGYDKEKEYAIPFSSQLLVKEGEEVTAGTFLTVGSAYPKEVLKILGARGVQDYILKEVQSVYRAQGVDINDKHVEVIVRQMLRKVRVEASGDTALLPGELVDVDRLDEENIRAIEKGGEPANVSPIIQGITKASLTSESFLSAASFQETEKVLTDAAIKSKVDPLVGLKENIILGKLIPAGTGSKEYKNLSTRIVGVTSAERYAAAMDPTEEFVEETASDEE
ncbi:MAG: DNA-directed RNA polymerase subunit beta' [Clostridia bacterium]|nr:DNA-directed RNA polymerase subunit beta' [Clostridia bacterium]